MCVRLYVCVKACRGAGDILSIFIYFLLNCCHLFHVFFLCSFWMKNPDVSEKPSMLLSCAVSCVNDARDKRECRKRNERNLYMGRSLTFICRFAIHSCHCQIVNFQRMRMTNRGWHKSNTNRCKFNDKLCTHQFSSFLSFYVRLFVFLLNTFNALHAKCCTSATDFPGDMIPIAEQSEQNTYNNFDDSVMLLAMYNFRSVHSDLNRITNNKTTASMNGNQKRFRFQVVFFRFCFISCSPHQRSLIFAHLLLILIVMPL